MQACNPTCLHNCNVNTNVDISFAEAMQGDAAILFAELDAYVAKKATDTAWKTCAFACAEKHDLTSGVDTCTSTAGPAQNLLEASGLGNLLKDLCIANKVKANAKTKDDCKEKTGACYKCFINCIPTELHCSAHCLKGHVDVPELTACKGLTTGECYNCVDECAKTTATTATGGASGTVAVTTFTIFSVVIASLMM